MSRIETPPILVAEDDASIRRLLAVTLRRRRLDVEAVTNGADAIAALRKRQWGAVVLDLMMPKVDGWEIVRWLGAHPEHRPRSVIVVSAADRDALRDLDPTIVNAIIFKPFDVLQLGAYIKQSVGLDGTDRRRKRIVRVP